MTTVNIDAAWLAGKVAPYQLTTANTTYVLQTDVTTDGTAFRVAAGGITLDLGGHVVTYDNAAPIVVVNGGFETGNLSGWDVSQAPNAAIYPAMLGMYGSWQLGFHGIATPQTIVSSPIAIPQAGIGYLAGIQAKAREWYTAMVRISVVDTITGATLGTPGSNDPGGGPIVKSTFTPTTTNPVVIKIEVTPYPGKVYTVDLDYACLDRTNVFGINTLDRPIRIIGGTIAQGKGRSSTSHPLYAQGSDITLDGVTITAWGMDTQLVYGNYAKGVNVRNCKFIGGLDRVSNRQAANAMIYLLASSGVIDIRNNVFSGKHQNGIALSGGKQIESYTSIAIVDNDIRHDSDWGNGYAIGIGGWCRNFEVARNTIHPVSGRGIIVDTSSTLIKDGTIHHNDILAVERGHLEYPQAANDVVALRMRTWDGTISNVEVSDNIFAAQTGIGPGIPVNAVANASGARFSFYNDKGQMKGCNLAFRRNHFKAIIPKSDPALKENLAWGFSIPRFDAGMGVVFEDNICDSNHIALNFGDNDGINETDITLTRTHLVKSAEGQAMAFSSMTVGNWGSAVHDIRMIGTMFEGGATPTPNFVGAAAKDISFGSTLTINVVGDSGPVADAPVVVQDVGGKTIFNGTTDTSGTCPVPVVLKTYSAAPGIGKVPTVTSTPQPLKVVVGAATATLTLTGDTSLTITSSGVLPTVEGACVLDGSGDLTAEGTISGGDVEGSCALDGAGDLAAEGQAHWRFIVEVIDPTFY